MKQRSRRLHTRWRRRLLLAAATWSAGLFAAGVTLADPDEPMPGKVAIVKPGSLAKFVAKPAVGASFALPSSFTLGTDGGSLSLFDTTLGGGGSNLYTLPAAKWTGLGKPAGIKGLKYKGDGSAGDPCKLILVKPAVVKGLCKGTGVTLTTPFSGAEGIVLSVGSSKRYCATFGGTGVKNDATLLKRKDAPAGACSSIPVATTTSTSTSTSTSSSTSSLPPMCGNGIVEAGEQCDQGLANGTQGSCCDASCNIEALGTVCRPAANGCDVAESCDGASPTCPADGFVGNGTPCDDGNPCTVGDSCTNGICVPGSMTTCGDGVVQSNCNEQCDDGDLTDGDGCNHLCESEQAICTPLASPHPHRILQVSISTPTTLSGIRVDVNYPPFTTFVPGFGDTTVTKSRLSILQPGGQFEVNDQDKTYTVAYGNLHAFMTSGPLFDLTLDQCVPSGTTTCNRSLAITGCSLMPLRCTCATNADCSLPGDPGFCGNIHGVLMCNGSGSDPNKGGPVQMQACTSDTDCAAGQTCQPDPAGNTDPPVCNPGHFPVFADNIPPFVVGPEIGPCDGTEFGPPGGCPGDNICEADTDLTNCTVTDPVDEDAQPVSGVTCSLTETESSPSGAFIDGVN